MKKLKRLQLILALVLCLSLSALFVACNTPDPVTISFETNGGSTIQEIQIDDDFQMPANPTKYGYVFDGWYIDQNLTTKFDETKIKQYTKSFVVFAKWADIPLDQISISTPVLSSNGNVVEWGDVEVTQDLDVTYFVAVDDGAALAYTAKSISLDMFTTGEHKVEVYAALATNNAKKSQTASVIVDVVATEDNAVINTSYQGKNSTLAKDGNDDVLVFYMGINETITNAQDITVDSPVVTISNPNNGTGKVVTPKSIGGPFKLTFTRSDNTQKVYKAYVRPRITGFFVLNNNVDDRAGYQISDDLSYTIGVANDFSFNVTMLDGEGEIIENRYVPLDIVFKKDNVVLSESETTYQNDKGVLSFDESLAGQNYTVSIRPKYVPARDEGQVVATMSINFTKGVNVFDNEGLKKAVNDPSVEEISIHNEIVAQYTDEQKLDGVDYAGQVQARYFTKDNYKNNANLYARFVESGDAQSLTINGNYFAINAKQLPRLKREEGKNDGTNGYELTTRKSGSYDIYNQESGLFAFGSSSTNKTDFAVTIKNLHILGNCDLSNETDQAELSYQFILEQSGSLHGIVASGTKVVADNVWLQNVMQGYQLRHNKAWINNASTVDMMTEAQLSYCKVENTFYSAVYVVNAKATVDHSYFSNSGAAIFGVADDYQYGSDKDNETTPGYDNAKSGCPYDPQLVLDASNVYDSWAVGNEAYYSTEEGMGGLAIQLKQTVNSALTSFGTNHTITDGEKFNFILQFISDVKYKKMSVVFMDGQTEVARLERGAQYTTTQTANDARLSVMDGKFLYPIGKYSDFANYLAMAMQVSGTNDPGQLMQPTNIALAVNYSFSNNLANFGKNKDRKMLEVISPAGSGEEITAIVEVMPVSNK